MLLADFKRLNELQVSWIHALEELGRLVEGFRQRDQGFDATAVEVGFMVDKVTSGTS
jgi:hypothetical protein